MNLSTERALIAAIRAWRPERGPFPAFADRCVLNQALLAVLAAARHKHQLLARPVSLDSEHGGWATADRERPGPALLDTLAVRDTRTDPEARLLVSEQLRSVVGALAGTLAGESESASTEPTRSRVPREEARWSSEPKAGFGCHTEVGETRGQPRPPVLSQLGRSL